MTVVCYMIRDSQGAGVSGELKTLVEVYIAERVARGELNGSSPVTIRSVLHGFAAHVAGRPFSELSERDIETWLATQDYKPATRNGMVNKVKPFIRWMVARDHIAKDFTVLLKAPKVPQGMPRYLEGEQVRELVRACRTSRDRLIVLLMVHLGLRRIEVTRIDMEDIDFKNKLLSVRGKNGRGMITRSLPITDEVFAAMHVYLRTHPATSGALIRPLYSERRLQERQVTEIIDGLMRDVGVKKSAYDGMSAHALRHSCAQSLIDSGVDIRLVQSALGHNSVTTTEQYLRRQPPGLRDAMQGRTYA